MTGRRFEAAHPGAGVCVAWQCGGGGCAGLMDHQPVGPRETTTTGKEEEHVRCQPFSSTGSTRHPVFSLLPLTRLHLCKVLDDPQTVTGHVGAAWPGRVFEHWRWHRAVREHVGRPGAHLQGGGRSQGALQVSATAAEQEQQHHQHQHQQYQQ